jgi:uncharacterized membrane protein YqhA
MESGVESLKNIQKILKKIDILPNVLQQIRSQELLSPEGMNSVRHFSDHAENWGESPVDVMRGSRFMTLAKHSTNFSPNQVAPNRREQYERQQEILFSEENTLNFLDKPTKNSGMTPVRSMRKSLFQKRMSRFTQEIKTNSMRTNFDVREFTIRYHKLWLTPTDQTSAYILHNEFKSNEVRHTSLECRLMITVIAISSLLHLFTFVLAFPNIEKHTTSVVARASSFLIVLLLALTFWLSKSSRKFTAITLLFVTYVFLLSLSFFQMGLLNQNEYIYQIELFFSFSLFATCNFLSFIEVCALALFVFINWLAWHIGFGFFDSRLLDVVFVLVLLFLLLVRKYTHYVSRIKIYNMKKINIISKNQQNNLISHFLPAHVNFYLSYKKYLPWALELYYLLLYMMNCAYNISLLIIKNIADPPIFLTFYS